MKFAFRLAVILIAASMSAQQPAQRPSPPAVAVAVSEIKVERKGCFGSCPRYTLTLRREGASTYSRRGPYSTIQISSADFDRLSKAVLALGFFDLRDEYGREYADTERVAVTVTSPSQSKTVETYNFAKAPFELWAVVMLADGLAANLWHCSSTGHDDNGNTCNP